MAKSEKQTMVRALRERAPPPRNLPLWRRGTLFVVALRIKHKKDSLGGMRAGGMRAGG